MVKEPEKSNIVDLVSRYFLEIHQQYIKKIELLFDKEQEKNQIIVDLTSEIRKSAKPIIALEKY